MVSFFKLLAVITDLILLLDYRPYSQAAEPAGSGSSYGLLASGRLVHPGKAHRHRGKMVFTKDSHAVVTLCHLPGLDASCKEVARQRIEGIKSFPISFRLRGDPAKVFSRPGGYYLLSAVVYRGTGDELHVGDLINDTWIEVDGPTFSRDIAVTKLEHCSSAEAGGVCSSMERSE